VSEAMANPPLRPLAPKPADSASRTTTSRPGSSAFACSAAHSPVNPPPTMHRSASVVSVRTGSGSLAAGVSRQNGRGSASAYAARWAAVGGVVGQGNAMARDASG
jgi:hypothetical protein